MCFSVSAIYVPPWNSLFTLPRQQKYLRAHPACSSEAQSSSGVKTGVFPPPQPSFFSILRQMGKNKALRSHTSTHKTYIVCQFNPTLPLQQQRKPKLPGAWACRPDLIPRDQVRWRQPTRARTPTRSTGFAKKRRRPNERAFFTAWAASSTAMAEKRCRRQRFQRTTQQPTGSVRGRG